MGRTSWIAAIWIAAIALAAGLPLAAYGLTLGVVPTVAPEEAREVLGGGSAVLIDIRPTEDYLRGHPDGAVSLPYAFPGDVEAVRARPSGLEAKTVLVLCESGILSAFATRDLISAGVPGARNVKGGLQAWTASCAGIEDGPYRGLVTGSGERIGLPERSFTLLEQVVLTLAGFVVKPIYSGLSLLLAVLLWRRPERYAVVAKWGLLVFFVGENACAVNFALFSDASFLMEYIHMFSMLAFTSMATWALFEAADERVVSFSAPKRRCAFLSACRTCIKHADVPCGLERIFRFVVPAHAVLALMPLAGALEAAYHNTTILGSPHALGHPVLYQVFEFRYCPVLGLALLAASLLALLLRGARGVPLSKALFAAAAGPLYFGFFRFVLFACYEDRLLWMDAWEELTELVVILGVLLVYWTFAGRGPAPSEAPAADAGAAGVEA